MIERLNRIPAAGDAVVVGPLELKVEVMDGPRLVSLSVKRLEER